jgi:Malectin domain
MDTIYCSERYFRGPMNRVFFIPVYVNPGRYVVNLHFAETYWNQTGSRVFDVSIQDKLVAPDLDIYKMVGMNTPYVVSSIVNTLWGGVKIHFTNKIDNAKLSGIEIIPNPL